MTIPGLRNTLPLLLVCSPALLLAGCSSTSLAPPPQAAGAGISGSIHGGQQPISGVNVQLYAVGTAGDGSASTPLLTQPVFTDSNGYFSITGLYTCPSASTLVYLVGTGGNPAPGMANPQQALMAALGPCGSLSASTFISVNEVTSVAAVYALAPFMSSYSAIGSGSSDAAALAGAFTLAGQFANTATGTSPGTNLPTGFSAPAAQINTVADLVSTCINSSGGAFGDTTPCGQLFSLTYPGSGPNPTDALAALLNLALHPALNTPTLYARVPAAAPFQPNDTTQPTDFAIYLVAPSTLTVNPASTLAFPNTGVSTTSAALPVVVTNNGPGSVSLKLALSGASAFSQTNNCPSTLATSASCTVQVVFAPGAVTSYSGSLTFTSSASNSPITVAFTGSGVPGTLSVSQSSLTFPATTVGQTAAAQTFTITNTGTGTTTLSAIGLSQTLPAQFTQTNNCPSTLAGGASCTVTATFTPSGPATPSATLTYTSNATTPLPTVTLSGTGVAVAGTSTLTLSDTQFFVPTSGTNSLTLTNTGASPITVSSLTTSTGFSQTNNCTGPLASGVICTVVLTAAPTTQTPFTGTLTVVSNASAPTQVVTLYTGGTVYNMGNAVVGYPALPVMTTPCQGGYPGFCQSYVSVTGVNAGDFSSTTCQTRSACSSTFTFVPSATGYRFAVGNVYLGGNSGYAPYPGPTTLFYGYGLPPNGQRISYSLSASVANVNAVGTNSGTTSITLTNTGNQPVIFSSITVNELYLQTFQSSHFQLGGTCSNGIPVGGTCTLTVTASDYNLSFNGGSDQGTITLLSNSVTPTVSINAFLNVVPAAPGLSFNLPYVTLPAAKVNTQTQSQAVVLTNTGNVPLLLQFDSDYTYGYTYSAGNCGTLAVGASCTFSLWAIPPGVGSYSKHIQIEGVHSGLQSPYYTSIYVYYTGQ